jgi:hypothetical protein
MPAFFSVIVASVFDRSWVERASRSSLATATRRRRRVARSRGEAAPGWSWRRSPLRGTICLPVLPERRDLSVDALAVGRYPRIPKNHGFVLHQESSGEVFPSIISEMGEKTDCIGFMPGYWPREYLSCRVREARMTSGGVEAGQRGKYWQIETGSAERCQFSAEGRRQPDQTNPSSVRSLSTPPPRQARPDGPRKLTSPRDCA